MVLRDDIADHRKFLKAGKGFGRGGASRAIGLYVAAIGYARKYATDGFVDDEFLTNFRQDPDAKKLAFALSSRRINLFHRTRGGYLIHDFHDYNPTKDKLQHQRQLATNRKRKQRSREAAETPQLPELVEAKVSGVTHLSRRDSRARVKGKGKGEGVRTRAAAMPQRDHTAVITAVVTKEILPRRLLDHELMAATIARCTELGIPCPSSVARKAIDSALFRYYRELRLTYGLPPDPRGIYHDHVAPRRKAAS